MANPLKSLALIAGALGGLSFLRKKAQQQQAEQELWTQATDSVGPTSASAGGPAATPPTSAQNGSTQH